MLVLGATGYVGGRLVSELLDAGHQVRVSSRSPGRAARYEWTDRVRLFTGDVLNAGTLPPAFEGCDAVYYLVHSIGTGDDFAATEATAAPERSRRGGRRWIATHRLPRRHGTRRRALDPPGEPARGGQDPGVGRDADDRTPRSGDHRGGVDLVRDAAVPHRGAPGDGHPPLGAHEVSADRDSRRPPLPGRRAERSRDGRPRARDRRARCGHLRRDDADLRRGRRAPAPHHSAGALPEPEALVTVGRLGDAAPRHDRRPSH